jgi:hypothetical protein
MLMSDSWPEWPKKKADPSASRQRRNNLLGTHPGRLVYHGAARPLNKIPLSAGKVSMLYLFAMTGEMPLSTAEKVGSIDTVSH